MYGYKEQNRKIDIDRPAVVIPAWMALIYVTD